MEKVYLDEIKVALTQPRILSVHDRWSIYNLNGHDSVASHSWYVTYYAHQFAELECRLDPNFSYRSYELLTGGLYHDISESVLGDMNFVVKAYINNHHPGVVDAIERQAANMLFGSRRDRFEPYMSYIDHGTVESRIIKAADKFECVVYLLDCIERGQNAIGHLTNPDVLLAESVTAFKKVAAEFKFCEVVVAAMNLEGVAFAESPDTPGRA